MTRRAIILLTLGVVLLSGGLILLVKNIFFSTVLPAALSINTFPKADVYLNDAKVGATPFSDEKLTAGDYVVKLLATDGSSATWTGKVHLTSETLTYINRNLARDDSLSAGETLSLEKLAGDTDSEIAVISNPTNAAVKLDGKDSGPTPLTLKNVTVGDHEIAVSAPGFLDRFIRGRTVAGYRLNIAVQLAKSTVAATASATPAATASAATTSAGGQTATPDKPYVVIKNTPTGWLRVRLGPSTTATEAGKVNPGEKYPLLDEQSGWDQIKLPDKTGWVSDSYVEKIK